MSAWFYTSKPNHSNQQWIAHHENCDHCDARVIKANIRKLNDLSLCNRCFYEMKDIQDA